MPKMRELWKAGKPNGKRQYQCKERIRKVIRELNYDKEFKIKAMQIFYEGNRLRREGRIMKINKSTVYNWIKALSKKVKESDSKIENEPNKEKR